MKLDLSKKFGTVHGQCSKYPGARYSQRGFVFNAHHKCLNPTEAKDKSDEDTVADATKVLLDKKAVDLKELTASIIAAQKAVTEEGTAAAKGNLTKLTKKYDALVAEIDLMGG